MSNELRFDIVVHGSPSEINAIKNCVDYDEEAVGYERNYEVSEETLSLEDQTKDLVISDLKYTDLVHVVQKITDATWYDNVSLPFDEALQLCIDMQPDPVLRGFLMAYFMGPDNPEVKYAREYCRPDAEGKIRLGSLQQWIHDNPEHMLYSTVFGCGG
jgi:hypothetical protein